jgi:cell division inhibitor SulA/protein ImuA
VNSINQLLNATPQLWKGRQANRGQRALPTGHAHLDRQLPGNGWPRGAMTELMTRKPGMGEFSLLFPALADTGRQGQWVILVDPPWIPYPATLEGHGLLLERLLLVRRRLQIAAEGSSKLAFLFRPENAGRESSPAALRLKLEPGGRNGIQVDILKCRGSRPAEPVTIPHFFSAYGKQQCQTHFHAALTEHNIHTALAGSALSAAGAGPAQPRPKRH